MKLFDQTFEIIGPGVGVTQDLMDRKGIPESVVMSRSVERSAMVGGQWK
jgi:hypothetical protein